MRGGFGRTATVARHEFRTAWRRVSTWVLLVILGLITWGLVAGNVTISTGGSAVGSERPHINSMFNIAFGEMQLLALFYLFFLAIAFGMSVIEDDNVRVGPMLHSTPLSPREYIWGRFWGSLAAYVVIVAVHVTFLVLFMQFYPVADEEKVRGPFALINYLWPTLVFLCVPIVFFGGVSFALGSISRQAVLVFLLPVATLLGCAFFLWSFSPEWLPHWVNRILQAIDPTAMRWMIETYVKVDRGANYYNTTAIPLDGLMIGNRLAMLAIGFGAVGLAAMREARRLRGSHSVATAGIATAIVESDRDDTRRRAVRAERDHEQSLALLSANQAQATPMAGFRASLWAEARELRRAPGLILFVPLIVLQVVGPALFVPGQFDTPLLVTPGGMAASTFNTVTLLTVLLLLFYATESLARDEKARTTPIVCSSGTRLGAVVAGRLAANCVVVLVAVLGGVYVGVCIVLLIQGIRSHAWIAPSPGPFLFVWSFLLLPTIFVTLSFIALAWAVTRSRFAVYGLGLGMLILTGWAFARGWVTWTFNWHLWGGVLWTDFGPFELDRSAIILNRVLWITVAVAFFAIALRVMQRRVPDAVGAKARRRPWALAKTMLPFVPFIVVPLILGATLAFNVRFGPGGEPQRKLLKDYWRKNINTWRDVRQPFVDELTLDLELEPGDSSFRVEGSYVLRNAENEPLDRFALTPGLYDDLEWTFEGATAKKGDTATTKRESPIYDSAGLWVFTPSQPLAKNETTLVGFKYHGRYPSGISRNASGAGEFILPSGVVLNSFSPSFLPLIGFRDGVGLEAENRPEAKVPTRDEWKRRTRPAFGFGAQTQVHAKITLPAEYRANCPGVLVSDEVKGDHHTMTWKTDQPIRFFNVVAGKWIEHTGERTSIWYLPAHERNIASMSEALDAARKYYSEWFHPYPWQDLRLTEFPGLSNYAQGFGTNIVFSESIGFKSLATEEEDAPFVITAHEAAHQWWGNILMPGDGPGGNILSEGMAHYSTARLCAQVRGERARQAFLRRIENSYADARHPDDERPMVEIDGERSSDGTVTYDKGGWVFTMMMDMMGAEAFDAGLRDFITTFKDGPDYPLLQDFIELMRRHAKDRDAYDEFVSQWLLNVVVPEFGVEEVESSAMGDEFVTHCTVTNKGTGRVTIEVAATTGKDRWAKDPKDDERYDDRRATITLGAGESTRVEIITPFQPKKVVVDPDVRMLQLKRKQAEADVAAEPHNNR